MARLHAINKYVRNKFHSSNTDKCYYSIQQQLYYWGAATELHLALDFGHGVVDSTSHVVCIGGSDTTDVDAPITH